MLSATRIGGVAVALALAAILAESGCRREGTAPPSRGPDPGPSDASQPLALVGVHVVAMDSNRVLRDQTVLIRGGRVVWLGPAARAEVADGSIVVEGGGRYVMPALIDMHAHLLSADLGAYVASGIGTVRNMWGTAGVRTLQRDIESGARFGPTVVSASPGVDGTPPQWPGTLIVTAPESAAAIVRAQAAAGWSYLKVYTQLTGDVFDSVIAAARAANIVALGHVPLRVEVTHALEQGLRSIEHLTGYDRAVSRTRRAGTWGWSDADTTTFPPLIAATVAAGAWNCPTLAIYAEIARQQHPADERERIIRNRRHFVRDLARGGGRLLLGTDAGIDIVAPGTSIHDELAEFVAAGLTPFEALRAGTADAADFLGRSDWGRVAVGAQADLLLLADDPLRSVGNARRLEGIVLRGAWRPAASLR